MGKAWKALHILKQLTISELKLLALQSVLQYILKIKILK